MKSYGRIKVLKNTKVFESESGYYDYWYPNPKKYLTTKKDCFIEHLANWKHQGEYIAFSIDQKDLGYSESRKICVWIREDNIPYLLCE